MKSGVRLGHRARKRRPARGSEGGYLIGRPVRDLHDRDQSGERVAHAVKSELLLGAVFPEPPRHYLWQFAVAPEHEPTYLIDNKDRMRYARLARRGLPLGKWRHRKQRQNGSQSARRRRWPALERARSPRRARPPKHRTERAHESLVALLLTPLRCQRYLRHSA